MKLLSIAIDQVQNGNCAGVAPIILRETAYEFIKNGHALTFFGPVNAKVKEYLEKNIEAYDGVLLFPAWFKMAEGQKKLTLWFCELCAKYKRRIVVVSDDVNVLRDHWPMMQEVLEGNMPFLSTNYLTVDKVCPGASGYEFTPYVPSEFMVHSPAVQPICDLMYVGCKQPDRYRMMKEMGLETAGLTVAGPGWEDTPYNKTRVEMTKFIWLEGIYRLAKTHISFQDSIRGIGSPSVSRFDEAWRSQRPVLFHVSHTKHRPDLPWDRVPIERWCWSDTKELIKLVDRYKDCYAEEAELQRQHLFPLFYVNRPVIQQAEKFLLEGTK